MTATFNQTAKSEILSQKITKKCCKKAHLLGLLLFSQSFGFHEIRLVTENEHILERVRGLFQSLFKLDVSPYIEHTAEWHRLTIKDEALCEKIVTFFGYTDPSKTYTISDIFTCDDCRAAFLKGVFLICGTVSEPRRGYHLELDVAFFNLSRELLFFMKGLGLAAKYTKRASHYILYFKESDKIIDFLYTVGATQEGFDFCNAKIEKEIRNNCNRLNNCETANLKKQIGSATRQAEAIRLLEKHGLLSSLSDELHETAILRLENPQSSLDELAKAHHPPITKSCVNRRLNKLVAMSETLSN